MIYSLKTKIAFGKHKGETIQEIIDEDSSYIEWCLDTIDDFELDEEADDYLEKKYDDDNWNEKSHYPSPHWSDW
jgi:hypothetical protein